MVFDDGHIWCVKNYNEIWYTLDSLSNKPKSIEFQSIFNQKGFGWIIIWKSNKSISNEKSIQSNKINQRKKSSPKHNCMKEDVDFNGSF